MNRSGNDRVVRALIACVLLCALMPASAALAIPSANVIPSQTPAQAALSEKLAEYQAVARDLERTRADVAQSEALLAEASNTLEAARSALASRAVEIYRTPPTTLVDLVFSATSVQDFYQRMGFLARIAENDAYTLKRVRLAQTEEAWLKQSQELRVAELEKLQGKLDKEQAQIVREIAAQPSVIAALAAPAPAPSPADVTGTGGVVPTGSSPTGSFVRENVIAQAKFRAPTAMTVADIQAFLNAQPGALKSYSGPDHNGVTKSAAQMIAEACVNFNVSPKVILATLQKEQSLLSTKNPSQSQYNGAMGAGMPDSGNNNASMQGFGNQIWWGAQKQDKNARDWHQGAYEPVDGTNVYPVNEGTFAQYRYTPHFSGVTSFWMIYWRYFGNPL